MIDRQTAVELLDNLIGMVEDTNGNDYDTALKMGIEALKAERRARWEYVDYGGIGNYHCSRCRAIGKKGYEYCPRCGSEMKGLS